MQTNFLIFRSLGLRKNYFSVFKAFLSCQVLNLGSYNDCRFSSELSFSKIMAYRKSMEDLTSFSGIILVTIYFLLKKIFPKLEFWDHRLTL